MCLQVDKTVMAEIHGNHMGQAYTIAYKVVTKNGTPLFRASYYNGINQAMNYNKQYKIQSNRVGKGNSKRVVHKGIHVYLKMADAISAIVNTIEPSLLVPVVCYHKDLVACGLNHDACSHGAVYLRVYTQLP